MYAKQVVYPLVLGALSSPIERYIEIAATRAAAKDLEARLS